MFHCELILTPLKNCSSQYLEIKFIALFCNASYNSRHFSCQLWSLHYCKNCKSIPQQKQTYQPFARQTIFQSLLFFFFFFFFFAKNTRRQSTLTLTKERKTWLPWNVLTISRHEIVVTHWIVNNGMGDSFLNCATHRDSVVTFASPR